MAVTVFAIDVYKQMSNMLRSKGALCRYLSVDFYKQISNRLRSKGAL